MKPISKAEATIVNKATENTPEATPEQQENIRKFLREERIIRTEVQDEYTNLIQRYLKWAGQATPVKREWVKASERLPEDCWQGKFRKLNDNSLKEFKGIYEQDKSRFSTGSMIFEPRFIEWLGEPLPATPAIELLNDFIKSCEANILLANQKELYFRAKEITKLFTSQGGEKNKNNEASEEAEIAASISMRSIFPPSSQPVSVEGMKSKFAAHLGLKPGEELDTTDAYAVEWVLKNLK